MDMYDPTAQDSDIQAALAQAAALRKGIGAVTPQGQMVSGHYIAPGAMAYLAPMLGNALADYTENGARQKSKEQATQANTALNQWLAARPQASTAYGAGDEGPTMTKTTPTDQDQLAWAAQGLRNPLSKTLATNLMQDTVVNAPVRQEKAADKLTALQMTNQRFAEDRAARIQTAQNTLQQRASELEARIELANKAGVNSAALQAAHDQVQIQIQQMRGQQKLEQIGASNGPDDGSGGLSPQALDAAASRYNVDGTLPPLGMGKQSAVVRNAVLNRASVLAGDTSGSDQRVFQMGNKSNSAALTKLQTQQTNVGAFERNFQKNADLVEQQAAKVDNTGVPIVQKWLNVGKRSVAGDADLAAFDTGVKSVVNEYTKIISGSMGNTAMAEGEIKKVEGLLNAAQSPQQLKAVLDFMRKETANRMAGFDEEKASLIKNMTPRALPKATGRVDGAGNPAKIPAATQNARDAGVAQTLLDEWAKPQSNAVDRAGLLRELKRAGVTNIPPPPADLDAGSAPASTPKVVNFSDLK